LPEPCKTINDTTNPNIHACSFLKFVDFAKLYSYYGYENVKEYIDMCGRTKTNDVPVPEEIFGAKKQRWLEA
jgi:hypothetical protein